MMLSLIVIWLWASALIAADSWPYNRYYENCSGQRGCSADHKKPELNSEEDASDLFLDWLKSVVNKDNGTLAGSFKGNQLPSDVRRMQDISDRLEVPSDKSNYTTPASSEEEAAQLFSHLAFDLDPACTSNRTKYWYRSYDGSCNWLKQGETNEGALGQAKPRDYKQYSYADGVSKPRDGPNARAVSNAFFKRKDSIYYEHTPLLLGLIEFIMHDVTYSEDSTTEYIDVDVPEDEQIFDKGTSFRVWRTKKIEGTGTSKSNPREVANKASAWLDLSALYGSTEDVALKLRSRVRGKLLTFEHQAAGTKKPASYLPWNSMDVPTRTRPGVKPEDLFAGGDPRTNEDWLMLGVHTLLLREHNRLCDILAGQHPEYDDEQIYQTIRLVMSAKYVLIANSYQMAYWTEDMPWPRDDGFPLYRQMYGETSLEINPANTYPWPLVTKGGKPMIASAEMAIAYRFHEFIIPDFPIIDAANNTVRTQDLFQTGFDSTGFVDTGLESILRGTVGTTIPNFKSGVDEAFRSAGKYRGKPFDIVTWSIVHEREQGIPTFNQYYRAYNEQDPEVEVPIRNTFEDFSSDAEMVAKLKELYNHPDDVDLVVGVQLDEEMFPGTSVPKSALIVSLFSLFGVGNSDRFSVGYAMMRCLLVDKPWDCHPSNALEDLLWKRQEDHEDHPDFRFYDTFWLQELDFQAHGQNLLWRIITENTEIKCIQQRPLFPVDEKKNPVLCTLPEQQPDPVMLIATAVQVSRALVLQHKIELVAAILSLALLWHFYKKHEQADDPPVLTGWAVLGRALTFAKSPMTVLQEGKTKYRAEVFGWKMGPQTHYLITNKKDMEMMMRDSPYEVRFGLKEFFRSINFNIVTKEINFTTDLHTKLVRHNLTNPEKVALFHGVIEEAATKYLIDKPLATLQASKKHSKGLSDWSIHFIAFVFSRLIVGPKGYDDPNLLDIFIKFNQDATFAMVLSSIPVPGFKWIAALSISRDFRKIWGHLKPVIQQRRKAFNDNGHKIDTSQPAVFMDYIIEATDDDRRVSDIVALLVFGGLANLQGAFTNAFLDVVNEGPAFQSSLLQSLEDAVVGNLDAFKPTDPWKSLRSATFESIRLAGSVTGPSRMLLQHQPLPSRPAKSLTKGDVADLSSHFVHRDPEFWGSNAAAYQHDRFIHKDPNAGDVSYISWGLKGPHMCPGRWLAMAAIQIMIKASLEHYIFDQSYKYDHEEEYLFPNAQLVDRKVHPITVTVRNPMPDRAPAS